jgi:hypothetical protein
MRRSIVGRSARLLSVASVCSFGCGEQRTPEVETSEHEVVIQSTVTIAASVDPPPGWPRRVCFTGDHLHEPYLWTTSWNGQLWDSRTTCYTPPFEHCGVWAYADRDTPPSGLPHTSGNTPSANAIDVRDFTALPASQTVPINVSAALHVPELHASHHCDGQGVFSWEVYSSITQSWSAVPGTTNLNPALVSSPTTGSETYRIRCAHPDGVHFGSSMTVTFVAAPQCAVTCVQTVYPTFRCTISVFGGTGSYTYYANYDGGAWQSQVNPSNWTCKYRVPGLSYVAGFKARDSAGNECLPRYWMCGGVEDSPE